MNCEHCSKPFTPSGKTQRFCSRKCQTQHRHAKPDAALVTKAATSLLPQTRYQTAHRCRKCGSRIFIDPPPWEDQRLCSFCYVERYRHHLGVDVAVLKAESR